MTNGPVLLGLLVLAVIFVLASWRGINVGTLAFPGALLVGTVGGLDLTEMLAGFPSELFVVVVGITYLFGIAQTNGTIDWLLESSVRMLRGKVALLPVLCFLLAFAITAIGAVGTATMAMTLPIAMGAAYRYQISPFMMAMVTTCGMQAGFFSPNAVYSATVVQILQDGDLSVSRLSLFLAHAVLNLTIAAVVYFAGGGIRLLRTQQTESAELVLAGHSQETSGSGDVGASTSEATPTVSHTAANSNDAHDRTFRWATFAALILLFCGVLILELDPGLLAIGLGAILMLSFGPRKDAAYVSAVSWPTVLMITGILTYVGVLDTVGALDAISDALTGTGSSTVGILLIAYMAAIVSAFASSIGTMGAVVPLAVPLIAADPSIGVLGAVTTITASTYLVDPSPLSILGALVLANARDKDRVPLFRKLTLWALGMALIAPLVAWTLLVLPS